MGFPLYLLVFPATVAARRLDVGLGVGIFGAYIMKTIGI